jgi:RNA polymerase sigma-70 factor (sigma-E family)
VRSDMSDHSQTFHEFVASRSSALLRTAFLLTGDRQLAEDLVQTALLKAARVWSRIEASPEAYVRKIMYHENISWWRRRRLAETSLSDVPELPAGTADQDARLMILTALAQLTPKQRTVLVLRYLEDLSVSQTARVLGIGDGTVKSMTKQALNRLRTVAPDLSDLMTTAGDVR